eukprot:5952735-Amphidinium_carterae.2
MNWSMRALALICWANITLRLEHWHCHATLGFTEPQAFLFPFAHGHAVPGLLLRRELFAHLLWLAMHWFGRIEVCLFIRGQKGSQVDVAHVCFRFNR